MRAWSRVAAGTGYGHPAHPVLIRRGPGSTEGRTEGACCFVQDLHWGCDALTRCPTVSSPTSGRHHVGDWGVSPCPICAMHDISKEVYDRPGTRAPA